MKKALVAGGTGLIGGYLLKALENDAKVQEVVALARNSVEKSNSKVQWKVTDFDRIDAATIGNADVVFCCLGTTIKKAGSQEKFRKVDHDYVVRLAKAAKAAGCQKFLVVSAIGSDADSRIFYNRVKGEMENALRQIAISRTVVFHPSMLVGPRSEKRLAERIGIAFIKVVAPLMAGGLRKYRPIQAKVVAEAMLRYAKDSNPGFLDVEYDGMVSGE